MEGVVVERDDASSRCIELIHERCGVAIHELQISLIDEQLRISGVIGSWHGKQLASEAARSLFPDRRICNHLQVITPH
ncbi:MAG: hypothetical protein ABGZ35_27140 [Planctomycetaceae bacterium]|jgi:hypothetical protein